MGPSSSVDQRRSRWREPWPSRPRTARGEAAAFPVVTPDHRRSGSDRRSPPCALVQDFERSPPARSRSSQEMQSSHSLNQTAARRSCEWRERAKGHGPKRQRSVDEPGLPPCRHDALEGHRWCKATRDFLHVGEGHQRFTFDPVGRAFRYRSGPSRSVGPISTP